MTIQMGEVASVRGILDAQAQFGAANRVRDQVRAMSRRDGRVRHRTCNNEAAAYDTFILSLKGFAYVPSPDSFTP